MRWVIVWLCALALLSCDSPVEVCIKRAKRDFSCDHVQAERNSADRAFVLNVCGRQQIYLYNRISSKCVNSGIALVPNPPPQSCSCVDASVGNK